MPRAGDSSAQRSPLEARGYLIEEYTQTLCPLCFQDGPCRSTEPRLFKEGMLVSHGGKVWMRRFCEVHGETESLYEEDLELWRARRGWSVPTSTLTPDRPGNMAPFPLNYQAGLPASHGQHTCILLLNLTAACDSGCCFCYAGADPADNAGAPVPTIEQVLYTVQTIIEREGGRLGVLMLSGGEPTLRADLAGIIEKLAELPITRIMLNTNGLTLGSQPVLLETLARLSPKVEAYLQFDGFKPGTYQMLRNLPDASAKLKAVELLNEARVFFTLVPTVVQGINEDEVGAIVKFGLAQPYCGGVAIQPAFLAGRFPQVDPAARATPTGVLRRLGEQTGGLVRAADFIALPCSHADCCDITYLLQGPRGRWRSLTAVVGRERLRRWLHLAANTVSFDDVSRQALELVRSGSLKRALSQAEPIAGLQLRQDLAHVCACVPSLGGLLQSLWKPMRRGREKAEAAEQAHTRLMQRIFRITIKQFMDAHTFHYSRLRQCCVHTGTYEANPRRYSMCWRWLFADAADFPVSE